MNEPLDQKIKTSFSQIDASDELKNRTKAFLKEKAFSEKRAARPMRRRLVPALACAAVVLMAVLAYPVYFLPTCVISVDINPSLELGVNRFDRVVSVTPMNEDGEALANAVNVQYLNYEQAVEALVDSVEIQSRLEEDELLSIAVVEAENNQSVRILEGIQRCTQGQKNTHCYAMTPDEAEGAHESGLSYGKYRAFLELQALDPSITVEDVQGLTMREIREWIDSLQNGETGSFDADGHTVFSGQGGGYGYGRGQGQGQGQGYAYGRRQSGTLADAAS